MQLVWKAYAHWRLRAVRREPAIMDAYVAEHSDIDTSRIYIGGCSNGGYMTMNMLIHYPDTFAAAYPVCEAYNDEFITDEEINVLKDIPIWFTHALDNLCTIDNDYIDGKTADEKGTGMTMFEWLSQQSK